MAERYDDEVSQLDSGDQPPSDWRQDPESSSPGILSKTLRNVGLLVIVCVIIAVVAGNAGDQLSEQARQHKNSSSAAGSALSDVPANTTEMRVTANAAGHFLMTGEVGSTQIRFLLDTGATKVVLSPDDARRAGLDLQGLSYTEEVSTANGIVKVAPLSLRRLRIGQIVLHDVEALVNQAPMRISLLGMSFLKRLHGWQVQGDNLIIAY